MCMVNTIVHWLQYIFQSLINLIGDLIQQRKHERTFYKTYTDFGASNIFFAASFNHIKHRPEKFLGIPSVWFRI